MLGESKKNIKLSEINKIHTSQGWKFYHDEACIEGLVSIPYNFEYKKYARVYQFIKLYLWSPSSGLYGCPISMTDGACFVIEQISLLYPKLLTKSMNEAYRSMITNNPKYFWTSGQWVINNCNLDD